jgi:hypothetical protein
MTTNAARMGPLIVAKINGTKNRFLIQSLDASTKTRQSSRALTEDELRAKLAEDFGKSYHEIETLVKSANDDSPV